nr:unnamed protein product [Callosobruchus chinensis]
MLRKKCDKLSRKCLKYESDSSHRSIVLDNITFEQYKQLTHKFCPSSKVTSCINGVLTQINKKGHGRRYTRDFKNYCLYISLAQNYIKKN